MALTAAARVNPVGFVVDKVALGQVFLRVLRSSPVSIIPPWAPHFRKLKKKFIHSFIHSPLHSSSSEDGQKARKSGRSSVRRQSHPHNQNTTIPVMGISYLFYHKFHPSKFEALCVLHFLTCFLRWKVVSPPPNPQSGAPPLVGGRLVLIQYIDSYLPYLETVLSIPNPRTRRVVVKRKWTNPMRNSKSQWKIFGNYM
jgi:hypothetical protein